LCDRYRRLNGSNNRRLCIPLLQLLYVLCLVSCPAGLLASGPVLLGVNAACWSCFLYSSRCIASRFTSTEVCQHCLRTVLVRRKTKHTITIVLKSMHNYASSLNQTAFVNLIYWQIVVFLFQIGPATFSIGLSLQACK
jgi:hypothetical protein